MPKKNQIKDRTGERIGRRTITGYVGKHNSRNNTRWAVLCDCGHSYVALIQTLIRSKGCKWCSHKDPRPYRRQRPYEATFNALKQRTKHKVELTYEQFAELAKQNECHYCGAAIKRFEHRKPGNSTASNLDRVDSKGPYSIDNVVVCCLRCNLGKNIHFTYDEWKKIGNTIRSWNFTTDNNSMPTTDYHCPNCGAINTVNCCIYTDGFGNQTSSYQDASREGGGFEAGWKAKY